MTSSSVGDSRQRKKPLCLRPKHSHDRTNRSNYLKTATKYAKRNRILKRINKTEWRKNKQLKHELELAHKHRHVNLLRVQQLNKDITKLQDDNEAKMYKLKSKQNRLKDLLMSVFDKLPAESMNPLGLKAEQKEFYLLHASLMT